MTGIELAMMVLQAFCCVEAASKGLWWKSLYWLGALLLTLAVVKGLKT